MLTQRIREVYPELRIESARSIEAGQYNTVLVVNEHWVFRFPRFAEGVQNLQTEAALLREIHAAITLAVPEPVFTAFEPPTPGQAFVGYRMIAGEPLWRQRLARIDDEPTLDRLATQLAGFLRELHGITVSETIQRLLPGPNLTDGWRSLYARIGNKLFPLMSAKSRRRVYAHFEGFLNDPANLGIPQDLVHGDFGGSNILFNPERGEITGVIDFGSSHLGDPALDFAALATYGEPFLRRVQAVRPMDGAFLDRVQFYLGTFALQEALYGLEHDDRDAFERGIAAYR